MKFSVREMKPQVTPVEYHTIEFLNMDGIQVLLVVVVIVLTILLFVVGLQILLTLTDVRRGLKKINAILDDSILGGGLLRPEKLSEIIEFFRRGNKSEMKK